MKYAGPFSMGYRERGSNALGVYPTQDTSRVGTARVKQEEEADTRIMQESSLKYGKKERGHQGESPPSQTRPN